MKIIQTPNFIKLSFADLNTQPGFMGVNNYNQSSFFTPNEEHKSNKKKYKKKKIYQTGQFVYQPEEKIKLPL